MRSVDRARLRAAEPRGRAPEFRRVPTELREAPLDTRTEDRPAAREERGGAGEAAGPAARGMRPFVIGLLGGIASGKSRVAALLARRGARVLDADALAHAELARPEVRARIAAELGPGAIGAGGEVDRAALARRVFADPSARRRLEAIVHPGVIAAIEREIRAAAERAGRREVVVLDVPLLAEAGIVGACDELVFVGASIETREARARARGWPQGEVARREASQRPLDEKRRAATFAIDNDGDIAATEAAVDRFWRERVEPAIHS